MTAPLQKGALQNTPAAGWDWERIAYLVHLSRALDALEEKTLVPERKIFYQFSARGHDMAQIMLGQKLTRRDDAICGYYRSRPILLSIGVAPEEALGSALMRAGGYSDGRDIGTVFNYPQSGRTVSASHVRRRRRAIHADGGLGAGARIPGEGSERDGLR